MIHLRLATKEDIPALMLLIRRVVPLMRASGNLQWDDTYPNPTVFTRDVELRQLWLAELNGRLVGAAALTLDQSPEYADVGWDLTEPAIVVHRLVVDPEVRGKGIATVLMQKAEALAVERGLPTLRVDTNTNNTATQRLFPKLGYTYSGEISLRFREGLRFACFEKRLN